MSNIKSNVLLYDGDFNKGYPPHIELNFYKIKNDGLFFKLLSIFKDMPIEWRLSGFLLNYKPIETINAIKILLNKEFPNMKIKFRKEYDWGPDGFHNSGGSREIILIFKDKADEAEFIIKSKRIGEDIKSNSSLVMTP